MRVLSVALLLSSMTLAAPRAQTPSAPAAQGGPPGVTVVKSEWSKERIGWERDPFGGPNENFDEMRARSRSEQRVLIAKRGGNSAEIEKAERDARADAANLRAARAKNPPRYAFLYKATVKNAGDRAVASVDWDYVFLDAATGDELNRHQFTSDAKIAPGKGKTLTLFVRTPPTRTISVQALDGREREGLAERVEIVRVVYSDGTVWERR